MRFWLFSLLAAASLAQDSGPHRLALVIGNSGYSALPAVPSAIQEARTMSKVLSDAGFQVTVLENVGNDDFFTKASAFLKTVKPGDVCLFYFSGHGAQIVDDDDYLLPVDFVPSDNRALEERAFRLTRLIQDLHEQRASLEIILIEAPRRIPTFIKGATGVGMAMLDLRKWNGTLLALAAGPGQTVVSNGPGSEGSFTHALAEQIARPGIGLSDLLSSVTQDVGRTTSQRQLPVFNLSVLPDTAFYFHDPAPVAAPPPPTVVEKNVYVTTTIPVNRKDRQEYVFIPPGKFKMGCVPSDSRCDNNEKPQHEVTLNHGFWLGRTEVTVDAYSRFIDDSHKKLKMPKATQYNPGWQATSQPMMMVTWSDAAAFCEWAGGRLPTEAEWEYAARAGKENQIYPINGENSRDKANFDGKSGNDHYDRLAPVKSFDESEFHLFDMAGNVWEWVSDWYSQDYYKRSPSADPTGPDSGKEHVKRGGSFESAWKDHLRISVREPQGAAFLYRVGFRCALNDSAETKSILNLR